MHRLTNHKETGSHREMLKDGKLRIIIINCNERIIVPDP